jgi:monofunctional biosynthetic peptidoglycan transglycosylase
MEVYLNSIEMGMVYTGAQAASEHWYRKEAANLTQFKQLELAILPNPKIYCYEFSSYINNRKQKLCV